jgi:hypothetical protein
MLTTRLPAVASKFHVCHRKQGGQVHGKWVADALAIIGTTCPRQVFHFKHCRRRGWFVKPCKLISPQKMQIKTKRPLRVGLFGISLDAYWPQFKGLKPHLEGYVRVVRDRLRRPGVEVVNLGLIDSPFEDLEAGYHFQQEDAEIQRRGISFLLNCLQRRLIQRAFHVTLFKKTRLTYSRHNFANQ